MLETRLCPILDVVPHSLKPDNMIVLSALSTFDNEDQDVCLTCWN